MGQNINLANAATGAKPPAYGATPQPTASAPPSTPALPPYGPGSKGTAPTIDSTIQAALAGKFAGGGGNGTFFPGQFATSGVLPTQGAPPPPPGASTPGVRPSPGIGPNGLPLAGGTSPVAGTRPVAPGMSNSQPLPAPPTFGANGLPIGRRNLPLPGQANPNGPTPGANPYLLNALKAPTT